MADADPGNVSDEDSTEMKALKKGFALNPTVDVDSTMLYPQSGSSTQAAEMMLKRSYTVLPNTPICAMITLTRYLGDGLRREFATERS